MEKGSPAFHGCFTKNRDETKKLIEKGKGSITPTNSPFWKFPEDFPNGIKTRSQEKKSKTSKRKRI